MVRRRAHPLSCNVISTLPISPRSDRLSGRMTDGGYVDSLQRVYKKIEAAFLHGRHTTHIHRNTFCPLYSPTCTTYDPRFHAATGHSSACSCWRRLWPPWSTDRPCAGARGRPRAARRAPTRPSRAPGVASRRATATADAAVPTMASAGAPREPGRARLSPTIVPSTSRPRRRRVLCARPPHR